MLFAPKDVDRYIMWNNITTWLWTERYVLFIERQPKQPNWFDAQGVEIAPHPLLPLIERELS